MKISNLNFQKNHPFEHPEYRFQKIWNWVEWGLLLLALSPFFGAIALFWAILATGKQKFKLIRHSSLNRGLFILSIWLIFVCFFSSDTLKSLVGLFNFIPFFLVFVGLSYLIQTPAQLRRMAWLLVVGSVPVVIIGLGQLFLGWKGPIILLWIVINWILAPAGNPVGRMSSVFEYANVLANYLVITFILGLGLWFEHYQGFKEYKKNPFTEPKTTNDILEIETKEDKYYRQQNHQKPIDKNSYLWRWLFLTLAVLANGIGLILTNSRNAWGLAGVACLAFALYVGWRWLVAAVVTLAGGVFWSAFGPSPVREWLRQIVPKYFWARLTDEMYQRPIPTLRVTQWQFAWNGIIKHPWTGWGFRNFPPEYYQHFAAAYQGQALEWPQHPHNLFLMLMYESGLPATLLLCGLVGWVLFQGILLFRDKQAFNCPQDRLIFFTYILAFFGTMAFHLFDVTLFDLRVNILGWLLLASIWGLVAFTNRK